MSNKTIEDAAKQFSPEFGKFLVRAFKATGYIDLYDGRAEDYMQVIARVVEHQDKRLNQLVNTLQHISGVAKENLIRQMD